MTDSKDTRNVVKLSPDVKKELDAAQYAIRMAEGRKPTHSELISRALRALTNTAPANTPSAVPSTPTAYRQANLPWHNKLEVVLNDASQAPAIQNVLEWAEQTVRNRTTQTRPAGKRAVGE